MQYRSGTIFENVSIIPAIFTGDILDSAAYDKVGMQDIPFASNLAPSSNIYFLYMLETMVLAILSGYFLCLYIASGDALCLRVLASGSSVCLDGRGKHFLCRNVAIGQEAERL